MSQVETVALWAGLISSIAGIVLSIAALVFGVWVNNRATEVNDQTIRSLQKIESAVERLSDDTRTLIKAGWDKMLGSVGVGESTTVEEDDAGEHEIASGLKQEVRSELGLSNEDANHPASSNTPTVERIEQVLNTLERTVAAQLSNRVRPDNDYRRVDILLRRIRNLSPQARALLAELSESGHLTTKEYKSLLASDWGAALRDLRAGGLISPLEAFSPNGKGRPVYWVPSNKLDSVRAALQLATISRDLRNEARAALDLTKDRKSEEG